MSRKSTDAKRAGVDRKIELSDLEQGLRSIKDDIDSVKESASGLGVAAVIGAVLLLIVFAFVIGRRRGRQKYAFVTVRRA